MSSPPQELHGRSGLPPNPYAAEDDILVQQWQRSAGAERHGLTLLEDVVMSTSTAGHEVQPRFSAQETYPWDVDMTQVRS